MSTQKVYPVYSFQYIQNKLVELSRQKLNSADVTPQEQADWIETDIFSPAYIKNKPTIPSTIGDVVGPSSSVNNDVALFDGTTGKLIKDSGILSTDLMLESVYDTDGDGIVDSAETLKLQVINKTGATITKGKIVYLKSTSSSTTYPEILLADNTSEATSTKTIGAVYEDILNNATGYVVTNGQVHNLDTSAYAIGTKLWLGTSGNVVTTPPTQPNHAVFIGHVTRSQLVNGRIFYQIQNGFELDELHNVLITTPSNNDVVVYESSTSLWKNKTLATILGYTPVPTTRTLTINGTAYDLSADRTWTISSGMTNPMTSVGDLILGTTAGAPSRLGIGTNGQVLTSNGTTASWQTPASGGMSNPMTTAGDIIYGGASGTPTRLGIGTSGYILQAGASAPTWFNLFGTANTFTATQTISSSVSGGTFGALVVKNTSVTTSQFVSIELQTGTGFYGGLKGFNDNVGGPLGNTMQVYSSKGLTFYTLGRTGLGVANTDPDMTWYTSNSIPSMSLFTNTANPYTRLQIYTNNAGSSYVELSLNVSSTFTRLRGYTNYIAMAVGTTEMLRADSSTIYMGANTSNEVRALVVNGYLNDTTIAGSAGTAITTTNIGGVVVCYNASWSTTYKYPFFTLANRGLGGYVATVPQWQLRINSPGSGSGGGRIIELTTPSSTAFTASQVTERWDIFDNNTTYQFKQHYIRTSIDTSGALAPASALLHLGAAATGYAQLNLKTSAGTAPSAPADGDIWYDGTNIKMRVGSTTKTFTLV